MKMNENLLWHLKHVNNLIGDLKHVALNSMQVTHGCIESGKMNENVLWHLRLGHAPFAKLHTLGVINNLPKTVEQLCVTCPMGILTKQPYNLSPSHAANPFNLLLIEVWGHIDTKPGKALGFSLLWLMITPGPRRLPCLNTSQIPSLLFKSLLPLLTHSLRGKSRL